MPLAYTDDNHDIVLIIYGLNDDHGTDFTYLSMSTGDPDALATGLESGTTTRVFVQSGLLQSVLTLDGQQRSFTAYDNNNRIAANNAFVDPRDFGKLAHGPISLYEYEDGSQKISNVYSHGRLELSNIDYADGSFVAQVFGNDSTLWTWDRYTADGSGTRTNQNGFFLRWNNSANQYENYNFADGTFIPVSISGATSTILDDARAHTLAGAVDPAFIGHNGSGLAGFTPNGTLIARPGATLIGLDGATLLGRDGRLIGLDGATLIGHDGSSLVGSILKADGSAVPFSQKALASLIGHDGSSLIGLDGATLAGGGNLIGHDGSSLAGRVGVVTGLIGLDGATLTGAAARMGGIDMFQHAGGIAVSGQSSGTTFINNLTQAMINPGVAVDSYVANALVIADANSNGVYDPGEEWTISDANGSFTLFGGGNIIVVGGTDVGTGNEFRSIMSAPMGAGIVTPLTSLISELTDKGFTAVGALAEVLAALGLDRALNLPEHDVVAGTQAGDASSAGALVAGLETVNVVGLIANAFNGIGVDLQPATQTVLRMLGDMIYVKDTVDLTDFGTILELVQNVVNALPADNNAADGGGAEATSTTASAVFPGMEASLAQLVVSANIQLKDKLASVGPGPDLVAQLNAIQKVTQSSALDEVRAAAGDPVKIAAVDVTPDGSPNPNPTNGTPGDDDYTAPAGSAQYDAGLGNDTVRFGFKLVDATFTWSGNKVIVDTPSSHTVVSGFETFVFADGTVRNLDGDALVDDLFYSATYHDVWSAGIDPDAHYHNHGWHEARDPSAFFDTSFYRATNQDVKAANIDPLVHFDQHGWKEGRVASAAFDAKAYLAAYPDVAAAQTDPLAHFLQFGAQEGRQPFGMTKLLSGTGFDTFYYLNHNPDVAAAGVDPVQHYNMFGWHEGRNPNAVFDTAGYLAAYADVAQSGANPLAHYHDFGWKEGRDPSVNFDTTSYRAAYQDVANAQIDPLLHYLQFGMNEGRSAFADGGWV